MSSTVKLYVYDLSNGVARQLSRQLTGRQIDGIWHTSVVVFGQEFFYGQGINVTHPGRSHHGAPLHVLDMGETFIDEDTFNDYIREVREHYTGVKYHLLDFNCNSFTNDVVGFLTGQSIPEYIKDLPTDFLSTPFGAALRPAIDAMYRGPSPSITPAPVPPPVAASGPTDPQLANSIVQAVAAQGRATGPPPLTNGSANAPLPATNSLVAPVHVITNPASFKSFLGTHKAAVVFFTSLTCGPCRIIEPVFESLAEDKGIKSQGQGAFNKNGAGFAKVDIGVGLGYTLASEWGITATPTFMFFLDGKKIQEVKGASSSELKAQVDMLLFQAYPPHPHTRLMLLCIEKLSFNPILFAQIPAFDAVIQKLDRFIAATTWPTSAPRSQAQAKEIVSDTVVPYLKARFTSGGEAPERPPPFISDMLTIWSEVTIILLNALPVENLFPVVDLWRLLILDPGVGSWMALQTRIDSHPLGLLLTKTCSDIQTTSNLRNLILIELRLLANAFANVAIAQKLVDGPCKKKITAVVVQTLLHHDAMVRSACASLTFNLCAALQKARVQNMGGGVTDNRDTVVSIDEDEEWEVEMISAIVEALDREKDNEDIVHRLVAALAFLVRFTPFLESSHTLLQVLQCAEVLKKKLTKGEGWNGEGGIRKAEIRDLVEEVVDQLIAE
ncbi:hypothetical protein AX17_003395 [Amanita inopinata Kibby_2008]|nr:hypothetical protein AX17_003395 [Amanita inopinata Kibby_2008]